MADDSSTIILSTTTFTSTKTLTRTIISLTSSLSTPTPTPHSSPTSIAQLKEQPVAASLYPYNPSLPLCIIFVILYFFVTIHHGYLSLYLPLGSENVNKHRYTVPLFVASIVSTIGYLLRCISLQKTNTSNVSLYTTSSALIIVSPIFVCATIYLLLTRLIKRCLPSNTNNTPTAHSPSPTKRVNLQKFLYLPPIALSIIFLTSDITSFLLQSLGAAIAASNNWTDPELSRGTHTILSGLSLQLTTFLIFLLVLHRFCTRVRNTATAGFNPCIMKIVGATWIASGFILLRTVFRLVEFAMGPYGYAFQHEWCLYIFEAFPIWVSLAVLAWWHPIKWIQERALAQTQTKTQNKRDGAINGSDIVIVRKPVGGGGGIDGSAEGHVRKRSRVGFAL